MTDATKDAIERVRAALNSPVSVMGGESFEFRVEDVKTVLTELDRRTMPIEAGEIAEVINTLNLMTTDHTKWEENRHRIARFIDRLARENERLREERDQWERNHEALQEKFDCNKSCGCVYDHADALCGYHSPQVIAAEARAERLAAALRSARKTLICLKTLTPGGSHAYSLVFDTLASIDAGLAALNVTKGRDIMSAREVVAWEVCARDGTRQRCKAGVPCGGCLKLADARLTALAAAGLKVVARRQPDDVCAIGGKALKASSFDMDVGFANRMSDRVFEAMWDAAPPATPTKDAGGHCMCSMERDVKAHGHEPNCPQYVG